MAVSNLDPGSVDALEWGRMERGWVHGNNAFREQMIQCLADENSAAVRSVYDKEQKRDLSEGAARVMLDRCLAFFEMNKEELGKLKKSDPRKMLIAGFLRYHFPVKTNWVCEVLEMGHFTTAGRAMKFYDDPPEEWDGAKTEFLKFLG